ncbi:MAG: T9SS type A sorting domain-containing protein [Melioribacteraceae bacterium]|nr:T9SS type A sorting domain-containing protein [Melioribacteraceae bacterium]
MKMKMKLFGSVLTMFSMVLLLNTNIYGAGFTNGSGNTFSLSNLTFSLSGNWVNEGTFTPGTSTVVFNGASGNQTINKVGGESFYNLTVNKASGDVQMLSMVTVSNTVTVTSGDIDLNTNELALGATGTLSETAGNTVKGTDGSITATRTLNVPSSLNAAGLGAVITSTANLGSTSFTRTHAAQTGNGNSGILRMYDIVPTTNVGLNATFVFNYDDSELNSITELELELYNSTDGSASWVLMGGVVNTANNTVTVGSIDGFSRFTLGGAAALPVELTAFTASISESGVSLIWTTATEVDNYGFEIQRASSREDGTTPVQGDWSTLGFVEGHGNSNSPKEYSFVDTNPLGADLTVAERIRSYRLKQIDTDGAYEFSQIEGVEIPLLLPEEYMLHPNYPNPFNPATKISFSLPKNEKARLVIYDMLGKEIAELINEELESGKHEYIWNAVNISTGVYFYSLQAGDFRSIKKMILLR